MYKKFFVFLCVFSLTFLPGCRIFSKKKQAVQETTKREAGINDDLSREMAAYRKGSSQSEWGTEPSSAKEKDRKSHFLMSDKAKEIDSRFGE